MNLNKKIFILIIFLGVVSLFRAYSTFINDNTVPNGPITNETDMIGCCSIVLQLDGNDTLMSYR